MLPTFTLIFFIVSTISPATAQVAPALEDATQIREALAAAPAPAPINPASAQVSAPALEGSPFALEQGALGGVLQLCSNAPLPQPSPVFQPGQENLQRVRIDDAEIGYLRFGNTTSGRPPLIIIPGYSETIANLDRSMLLEFAKNQEVIAVDLRGQGLSSDFSPAGSTLTIEGMANDTAAFASALNLTKPNVLGISMGGMITSALATNHGDSFGLFVVAHGSAGGFGNSTPPEPQAVTLLSNPISNSTALWDIIYDLNQTRGVDTACESYFNTFTNAIPSPQNSTTTQRQNEAVRQWVLFVLY